MPYVAVMAEKKRAFVGLTGPFGYAYAHERPRLSGDYSSPNAVLENVAGLLVCYDELYFLSRQFCPVDMWNLPYVHFVLEDKASAEVAAAAIGQARDFFLEENLDHGIDFAKFAELSKAMQSGSNVDFAIDNHTHPVELSPGLTVVGDANRAENVVSDVFLTQALSLTMGDLDLIVSSPALSSLTRTATTAQGVGSDFDYPRRALVSTLVSVRTENFLTAKGSYHESYEDLRQHSNVREFRNYLCSVDVKVDDVSAMAVEVSRLADTYAGKILKKHIQGPGKFRSLGSPALKGAANFIEPFTGTALGAVVDHFINKRENSERKAMAWAPFIYDLGPRGRW